MADGQQQYFDKHGLQQKLTEVVNLLAEAQPDDPYKFLAEQLGGRLNAQPAGQETIPDDHLRAGSLVSLLEVLP